MDKLSTKEVAEYVEDEGNLAYAIQSMIKADSIEDPELADLWEKANETLDKIEKKLKEAE